MGWLAATLKKKPFRCKRMRERGDIILLCIPKCLLPHQKVVSSRKKLAKPLFPPPPVYHAGWLFGSSVALWQYLFTTSYITPATM